MCVTGMYVHNMLRKGVLNEVLLLIYIVSTLTVYVSAYILGVCLPEYKRYCMLPATQRMLTVIQYINV